MQIFITCLLKYQDLIIRNKIKYQDW